MGLIVLRPFAAHRKDKDNLGVLMLFHGVQGSIALTLSFRGRDFFLICTCTNSLLKYFPGSQEVTMILLNLVWFSNLPILIISVSEDSFVSWNLLFSQNLTNPISLQAMTKLWGKKNKIKILK